MLKILAAVLMLVDHIGLVFFPHQLWLRMIGRLSMPLFAYAIATGYYFTARADAQANAAKAQSGELTLAENETTPRFGRFPKYLLTMAVFALVSQIPFQMMRESAHITSFGLNIGFTWTLALAVLHGVFSRKLLWQFAALLAVIAAWQIPMDYRIYGILYPLACYPIVRAIHARTDSNGEKATAPLGYLWGALGQIGVNLMGLFVLGFWQFQALALVSMPLMALDKGRKSRITKWFFYVFYPAHMLLLALLARWA